METEGKLKEHLILFLARRLPDCRTITPMLGESLDRRLSIRERVVTKLHLYTCEACRLYLEQIRFLKEAASMHASIPAEELSNASLSDTAKDRIKKHLVSSRQRPVLPEEN